MTNSTGVIRFSALPAAASVALIAVATCNPAPAAQTAALDTLRDKYNCYIDHYDPASAALLRDLYFEELRAENERRVDGEQLKPQIASGEPAILGMVPFTTMVAADCTTIRH